jgi:hypothetical protein
MPRIDPQLELLKVLWIWQWRRDKLDFCNFGVLPDRLASSKHKNFKPREKDISHQNWESPASKQTRMAHI